MAVVDDVDELIEQFQLALGEFLKGNPEPNKEVFSHREDVTPYALRVTMIFRPEDGIWKIVHRHADPITTAQPAESVIPE